MAVSVDVYDILGPATMVDGCLAFPPNPASGYTGECEAGWDAINYNGFSIVGASLHDQYNGDCLNNPGMGDCADGTEEQDSTCQLVTTFGDLGLPAGRQVLAVMLTMRVKGTDVTDLRFPAHGIRVELWDGTGPDALSYLTPDPFVLWPEDGLGTRPEDNFTIYIPSFRNTWTNLGGPWLCTTEAGITDTTPVVIRMNAGNVFHVDRTPPYEYQIDYDSLQLSVVHDDTFYNACALSCILSGFSVRVSWAGGQIGFHVTPSGSSDIAYEVSDASWVSVTGPVSGAGNVVITIASNAGVSLLAQRSGWVRVDNKIVLFSQQGQLYAI